jgi:hypothetical protein
MYEAGYPGLMRSLRDACFDPAGLAKISWSEAQQRFEEQRLKY